MANPTSPGHLAKPESIDDGSEGDRESDQGSTNVHFRKPNYALAENHGSMYLKMGAVCEFLFVSLINTKEIQYCQGISGKEFYKTDLL